MLQSQILCLHPLQVIGLLYLATTDACAWDEPEFTEDHFLDQDLSR